MLLRILAIVGLAAPHVLYVTWLATAFGSFDAIVHNNLAKGFFLEMVAASALLTLYFKANPLGKASLGWFVLFSAIGGAGMAIPAFYWLNKRSSVVKRKVKLTARGIAKAKKDQKEKLMTATGSLRSQPSLILNTRSA